MAIIFDALPVSDSTEFAHMLKHQLEKLPNGTLPLHQGTNQGGYVDDSDITVTVLSIENDTDRIRAKVGIFFTEIVVGCGCGDDPMPVNAYCEMQVSLDKSTAEAEFEVIQA